MATRRSHRRPSTIRMPGRPGRRLRSPSKRQGPPTPASWSTRRCDGRSRLHHRADLPGYELGVAITEIFRLGARARRGRQNFPENLLALLLHGDAVEDVAAVDVHVVDHAGVDL